MKPVLCASILSMNPGAFRPHVERVIEAGVDWIHFDVMDGQFVPPITFGAELVASLRDLGTTPFEAHLMTLTPEAHFENFIDAGCARVIFHAETTPHAHRLCLQLRAAGVESGVAINPGTPAQVFEPLLDVVDLALVMTVNPGWGGQKLVESCLEKVSIVRKMAPRLPIEVDGGVDDQTIRRIWDAGADTFVVGSHLAKATDSQACLQELRKACA